MEGTFHIPFISKHLESEGKNFSIEKVNFFDLIAGNEIHINNFYHDILGLPYQLDIVKMARDTTEFLNNAKQRLKKGLGRNELCICGSDRKYKWCHGLK